MRLARTSLSIASILLLSACASTQQEYPSLSIREFEQTRTLTVPQATPTPAPAVPAESLDRLSQLLAEARSAHQAFTSQIAATRNAISAARGADIESQEWAEAQIRLADLESERSRALIALADLDQLFIDAQLQAAPLDEISAVRDEVEAMVAEENLTVAQLSGTLGG
jgi:hypothetical protein